MPIIYFMEIQFRDKVPDVRIGNAAILFDWRVVRFLQRAYA